MEHTSHSIEKRQDQWVVWACGARRADLGLQAQENGNYDHKTRLEHVARESSSDAAQRIEHTSKQPA
jgi:hypothetical protein